MDLRSNYDFKRYISIDVYLLCTYKDRIQVHGRVSSFLVTMKE